ncbi:MAG: hypothetical protein ACTSXP_17615 [Promethearchaeota archaeon]
MMMAEDKKRRFNRPAGIILIIAGVIYSLAALTLIGLLIVFIPLMIVVIIGHVLAIIYFNNLKEKAASIASVLLLISEAIWFLLAPIFLVPIACALYLVQAIKSRQIQKNSKVIMILSTISLIFTIPFLFAFLSLFSLIEIKSFELTNLPLTLPILLAIFYIGRDLMVGIIVLQPWDKHHELTYEQYLTRNH